MATDSWINETLYPDWGQRFLVKRELARVQSDFQDIVIFESTSHGRVMVLDGVIQITEARRVRLPGDADACAAAGAWRGGERADHRRRRWRRAAAGAAASQACERAVMVEIDGEVIRLAKEFLPDIGGDAWNDPRAEVIVGDGIDYVKRAPDAAFDVIIVDSHRPDRRRRGAVHRRVLRQLRAHPDRARPGGEPVRRAVHAGRRTARDQRAAGEVLPACHRVCRGGADLCRRLHDAGLGGEGCVAARGAGATRSARARRRPASSAARATGRRRSMSARSTCRPISPSTCRNRRGQ